MILQIKQQIYELLTSLGYHVMDNPYLTEERNFPYLMITLNNATRIKYKNCYSDKIKFKIDIFSNYSGEKEVFEIEDNIYNNLEALYDNEYVTAAYESSFKIIDDKTTGVLIKHGVLQITVLSTGGLIDGN
jgi:hypothetical protein